MSFKIIQRKTLLLWTGALSALVLAVPPIAHALNFNIFSVIDSTISSDIGGALTSMTQIQNSLKQQEQTILAPVSLITQSHSYINTIMTSYRGWMSGVFTLPVNSAQLPNSRSLESAFLGGSISSMGSINSLYSAPFGALPAANAAPQPHRQMMDMDDALAKDALVQSVAADQATTTLVQMANQIESQSSATAPGTADMLSATARAAEVQSLATQHKLLAAMLREEAGALAHQNGMVKQKVLQSQQLNNNLQNVVANQ